MVTDCSPTAVQDWMLCPQYWQWRHVLHWQPRTVGKHEVQAWIGSAIHAGIAAWVTGADPDYGMPVMDAAMTKFNHSIMDAKDREVPSGVDERATVILPTLRKFIAQAPAWLRTACRGVEVTLGRARLDWIGEPAVGGGLREWLVVDFKTKGKKPKDYWGRAGMEIYSWELRRSWQFAEYVEKARTHPDSPAYGGVVTQMQVQTIILDEFEVLTDTFTPSPSTLSERLSVSLLMKNDFSAATTDDPENIVPVIWRNRSKCRNWFGGDCPYLRACWDYGGDETRMTVDYVKESRREGARAHT